jgi:hypothetical protein
MIPVSTSLEDGNHQVGPVTFAWKNKAALDTHAGSTNVPGEAGITALQDPVSGHWLMMRPIGANAVAASKLTGAKAVRLNGFYDDVDAFYQARRNGIKGVDREHTLAAAGETRELELFSPGGSLDVEDNAVQVRRPNGKPVMVVRAPVGWDSSDGGSLEGPGLDSKIIEYTLTKVSDVIRWGMAGIRIAIAPVAETLVDVQLPTFRDPTATITDADGIDDALVLSNSAANFGGTSVAYFSGGRVSSGAYAAAHLRFGEGSIPAGTIDALRFYAYRWSSSAESQNAVTLYAAAHVAANTWVEGSSWGGSPEVGACSHSYAKHNTQNWAGSTGGYGSGDYRAGETVSKAFLAYTSGPDVLTEWALKASWATNWRSGSWANNGFSISVLTDTPSTRTMVLWRQTEHSSGNEPYFEIDYTEVTVGDEEINGGERLIRDTMTFIEGFEQIVLGQVPDGLA